MTNDNPRGLPVAWKAEWHDWTQYHDETDPLPEKWDDAPLNVTPLVLATDYAALLAEADELRADARRWNFAVEHKCFPTIAQDGETWVIWGRNRDWKRRTFMGTSPTEAIDAAISAMEGR